MKMTLNHKQFFKIILFFLFFIPINLSAQVVESADFEQFSNGENFTRAHWQSAGFEVPWVNGFDAGRAIVDDDYAVSGSRSLRLYYPMGQFGTANTGGQAPLIVPPQDEYFASYYVRFSEDFSWGTTSEGGKLPGLAGGSRCSGCAACTGSNGFTARLMWRTGGKAVIYLYHMDKVNPPCGDNYDIVVDGKTLYFERGRWYKISQRVKVNSGIDSDGEVEMWINERQAQIKLYNGTLVNKLSGIQFVNNGDKVNALYFSTFHGGSSAEWAPVVDSYIWFDDFVISTSLSDVVNNPVTSVPLSTGINDLEIFPVPVRENELLRVPGVEAHSTVQWVDMMGKVHGISEVQTAGSVMVPSLNKGVYMIRFISEDKMIARRIVVE